MRTILVTGSTGFLGRHLVEQLKQAEPGARLRLLCRSASAWDQDAGVEIARGDITSAADVERALEGSQQVYHLAGVVSRNPGDGEWLYKVHVEGTRHLCDAACKHRPEKIVFVSSSGAIAVGPDAVVHDEQSGYKHEILGRWPYYLSKIFAEKLAFSYASQQDLPIVVVSPSLLLGPGDERGSSTGDVALFLRGQIKALPAGGLSFVDARDAAAGLIAAMRSGRAGERYLLGGPNWTFAHLIDAVAKIAGRTPPRLRLPLDLARAGAGLLRAVYPLAGKRFGLDDETIRMSALFWYCSSEKARAELGFTTRDPLETLRDTVEDLRKRAPR